MDEIRIWIEFLANIAGACGLLFFLYDYRKDKKEEKSKIDEMEKNTKHAIKVILNRALLKWNIDDCDDAIGKIDELTQELDEQELDEQENYSESGFKLAVINDLLLEIMRDNEEYDDDCEDQWDYLNRVEDIESAVKQLCTLLMEQAAIFSHVIFSNKDSTFIMKIVEFHNELEAPRPEYWESDFKIAEKKSKRIFKCLDYFLEQSETKWFYALGQDRE